MAFSQAITNRRDALRSQKEKLLNELAQSQIAEHEADALADSETEEAEATQKDIIDAEERIDGLLDLLQQARMLTAEYKKAARSKLGDLKNKYGRNKKEVKADSKDSVARSSRDSAGQSSGGNSLGIESVDAGYCSSAAASSVGQPEGILPQEAWEVAEAKSKKVALEEKRVAKLQETVIKETQTMKELTERLEKAKADKEQILSEVDSELAGEKERRKVLERALDSLYTTDLNLVRSANRGQAQDVTEDKLKDVEEAERQYTELQKRHAAVVEKIRVVQQSGENYAQSLISTKQFHIDQLCTGKITFKMEYVYLPSMNKCMPVTMKLSRGGDRLWLHAMRDNFPWVGRKWPFSECTIKLDGGMGAIILEHDGVQHRFRSESPEEALEFLKGMQWCQDDEKMYVMRERQGIHPPVRLPTCFAHLVWCK